MKCQKTVGFGMGEEASDIEANGNPIFSRVCRLFFFVSLVRKKSRDIEKLPIEELASLIPFAWTLSTLGNKIS